MIALLEIVRLAERCERRLFSRENSLSNAAQRPRISHVKRHALAFMLVQAQISPSCLGGGLSMCSFRWTETTLTDGLAWLEAEQAQTVKRTPRSMRSGRTDLIDRGRSSSFASVFQLDFDPTGTVGSCQSRQAQLKIHSDDSAALTLSNVECVRIQHRKVGAKPDPLKLTHAGTQDNPPSEK